MSGIPEALDRAVREYQAGNFAAAEELFQQALRQNPRDINALHLRGICALAAGALDLAADCIRSALQLAPDFAEAHNNLSLVLIEQGQLAEAIASARRALQYKPDYAEAHGSLAIALQQQKQLAAAADSWRSAIAARPDFAAAHYNLGIVLREQGLDDAAIECFRSAVRLRPEGAAAVAALVHSLQHVCRWDDVAALARRAIELLDQGLDAPNALAMAPFDFLTLPIATTAAQQLRCARNWVSRQPRRPAATATALFAAWPRAVPKPKITLGYASADFWSHPTAFLTAELFERHDRERFAVIGYSYGPDDGSPMRRRLASAFDAFVDLRDASVAEATRRIAADGVDILVDLKGHTQNSRPQLFAARPAPVQVNYLAYPGTTGAPYMDYILVDDFVVPADQQPFYSERLVHLPGCYQVNDSRREIAAHTPSRAECGLADRGFVFCSFNNNYKITPEVFDVWMDLLQAVPGSVLWLLAGNRWAPENLRREAAARGVSAERLVFAPRRPLAEHLARQRIADLFLDCFPVNAHTTASDALWAGCPVLTLAGETFVSRVAGSLLHAVGLPELVTSSLEQYRATALRLAQEPDALADLREKLAAARKSSPLFDAGRFTRHVEQAYATMWQIYTSGQPPRPFTVPAGGRP